MPKKKINKISYIFFGAILGLLFLFASLVGVYNNISNISAVSADTTTPITLENSTADLVENVNYVRRYVNGQYVNMFFAVRTVDSSVSYKLISLGDQIFLEDNQSIVVCFGLKNGTTLLDGSDEGEDLLPITSDVMNVLYSTADVQTIDSFKINGTEYTATQLGGISTGFRYELVKTSKDLGPNFSEGLFSVEASAKIKYLTTTQDRTFNFSFYVFNRSTYQNTVTGDAKVTVENIYSRFSVNSEISLINKKYFANYQQENLTTLTFNTNRFVLSITRVAQGVSYTYTVGDLVTKGASSYPDLIITANDEGDRTITLKDVGEYTITYSYIYKNNSTTTVLDKINADTTLNKKDVVTIFGYQAYYFDYDNGESEMRSDSVKADITASFNGTSNIDLESIAITNQAPVSFKTLTGVKLVSAIKYSYDGTSWTDGDTSYEGEEITSAGIYCIKLIYTFENYQTPSGVNSTKQFTQYFAFQIKNNTPTLTMSAGSQTLYANDYTNQNITLTFPAIGVFEDEIWVEVLCSANFNTTYSTVYTKASVKNLTNYTLSLTENGKYKITIFYGANRTKSLITYVTIDKSDISGISGVSSNNYEKGNAITGVFTDSDFALEWNEKASGAKITVKYYYMPLVFSGSVALSPITNGDKRYVENGYFFDYDNKVGKITYSNTKNTSLNSQNVLSSAGMYIFMFEDAAGNSCNKVIIIDNSPAVVLLKQGDSAYYIAGSTNIVANSTKVFWGDAKAIKITLGSTTEINKILSDYMVNSCYVVNDIQKVDLTVDSKKIEITDNYYDINLFDENNNVNETTYTFDIYDSGYSPTTLDVNVSTDLAQTIFKNSAGEQLAINGEASYPNTANSYKYQVYNVSHSSLVLTYVPNPDENIITSVNYSILFYELLFEANEKTYYYSTNSTTITFDDTTGSFNLNFGADGKTKAGKYVITRTYTTAVENVNLQAALGEKNDFVTREMIIFVDYSDIVSYPTVVSGENLIAKTGEYIEIKVGDKTFKQLYMQNQANIATLSSSPILITNNMPIVLVLPKYKFGTLDVPGFTATIGLDINSSTGGTVTYSAFELSAKIYANGVQVVYGTATGSNTLVGENGFLYYTLQNFSAGSNIQIIIEISDNAGDKWYVSVELQTSSPTGEFIASSQTNNDYTYTHEVEFLAGASSQNKTNAELLTIIMKDATSEYVSNIGKITYSINGGTATTILREAFANVANRTGYKQCQIDLSDCKKGDTISITLYFEGDESKYLAGCYSTTYNIVYSLSAPTTNITNIASADKIASALTTTRKFGNRYNISSKIYGTYELVYSLSGTYSFKFDDVNKIYVYTLSGDKYANSIAEFIIPTSPFVTGLNVFSPESGWDIKDSAFTFEGEHYGAGYYQIVEEDSAGNLTSYTVFYNPDASLYVNGAEVENNTISVSDEDVEDYKISSIESKSSSYSDAWLKINIAGKVYYKTPYTQSGYLLTDITDASTAVSLASINFVSGKKYEIIVSNRSSVSSNHTATLYYLNAGRNYKVDVVDAQASSSVIFTFIENYVSGQDQLYKVSGVKYYLYYNSSQVGEHNLIITSAYADRFSFTINYGSENWDKIKIVVSFENFSRTVNYSYYKNSPTIENEVEGDDISGSGYEITSTKDVYINIFGAKYTIKINNGFVSATQVSSNGVYRYKLTAPSLEYTSSGNIIGGTSAYVVVITANDDLADTKTYTITIDNRMPKIVLTNNYGVKQDEVIMGSNFSHEDLKLNIVDSGLIDINDYVVSIMFNNIASVDFEDGMLLSQAGTYTIVISFANSNKKSSVTYNVVINKDNTSIYTVAGTNNENDTISASNYITQVDGYYYVSNKYYKYYITNYNYITVLTDNSLGIDVSSTVLSNASGYTVVLYQLTNENSVVTQNINESFIVVKVSSTSSVLKEMYYYANSANSQKTSLLSSDSYSQKVIISEEDIALGEDGNLTLYFSTYNTLECNKVLVTLRYGNILIYDNQYISSGSIKLSTSGTYTLEFRDLAGNVQSFYVLDYFSLTLLNNVIYNVNGSVAIDYAIYDKSVVITIPSSTLSYYDRTTLPTIYVLKNGQEYTITETSSKSWTLTEPGFYQVSFSGAKVGEQTIPSNALTFTIIDSGETRWAFGYAKYDTYTIKSISRNGTALSSSQYVGADSLYLSIFDEGVYTGKYDVVISADSENSIFKNLEFAFTFWLNDSTAPIVVSAEQGSTSTDNIIVSFNPRNVYEELGNCVIKINGKEDIVIDSTSADSATNSITLSTAGEYYIKVYTNSGNLIYSYKVIKKDPLNAISIVIIIGVALLVVVLSVIFIKLRKRTRIR